MNHINPQHDNTTSTNTNAPTWRILRERRQDPFHFMISRPQPVNTALPLPPPPPPMSTLPISPESSSLDDSRKNRRVIASKRAAQNRAAQKAFRQRRDQYIKELEEQAKEAKESKQELNELRQENTKLKERVTALEHHIILLTGKPVDEKALQNIHIPMTSTVSPQPSSQTSIIEQQQQQQQQQNAEPNVTPPPPPTTTTTVVTALGVGEETSEEEGKGIELSAEQDTTKKADPAGLAPATMAHFWQDQQVDFDFAFDPFMENEFGMINEFLPNANNEQVLDDLFAMLQTRQRPQIPSSLEEMEKCS
ncbi:hypothetical protein RMATCC62417_06063 [Rhizopus microsporus]|nr:hypothetical protein RMATCC62417_06063 [Rhizopus microsporus]